MKRAMDVRGTSPTGPGGRERRYECPVCLGVMMEKLRPSHEVVLVLDYCRRCGGVWFDEGEVGRLRQCHPQALLAKVALSAEAHRARCRTCGAAIRRNEVRCAACGRVYTLLCPSCLRGLRLVEREGLRLDVCARCRGVWFDNVELETIWNQKVLALPATAAAASAPAVSAHYFPLDALLLVPDMGRFMAIDTAIDVGGAAAVALEGAASVGAGLADVAGALLEGTGELAGSVFEAIAEIIGGLFG